MIPARPAASSGGAGGLLLGRPFRAVFYSGGLFGRPFRAAFHRGGDLAAARAFCAAAQVFKRLYTVIHRKEKVIHNSTAKTGKKGKIFRSKQDIPLSSARKFRKRLDKPPEVC